LKNASLSILQGDVLRDRVEEMVRDHDTVISAYNPGWSNPNIYDDTIKAYRAIIEGVKKAGVKRLRVVEGAGSLEVSPGLQFIDTMKGAELVRAGILGLREVLYILRQEKDLDWTFLSPAATIATGERTGNFRLGKDEVLKDEKGESKISIQDHAVAMLDELEKPTHKRERFTVAY
jgi:putative NADH-flavin reductase